VTTDSLVAQGGIALSSPREALRSLVDALLGAQSSSSSRPNPVKSIAGAGFSLGGALFGAVGLEVMSAESAARKVGRRARELRWLQTNRELLQRSYASQWIVLEGETIVAAGVDPAAVVSAARRSGVRIPFVHYVDAEPPMATGYIGL